MTDHGGRIFMDEHFRTETAPEPLMWRDEFADTERARRNAEMRSVECQERPFESDVKRSAEKGFLEGSASAVVFPNL